jgi:hypothetical protein
VNTTQTGFPCRARSMVPPPRRSTWSGGASPTPNRPPDGEEVAGDALRCAGALARRSGPAAVVDAGRAAGGFWTSCRRGWQGTVAADRCHRHDRQREDRRRMPRRCRARARSGCPWPEGSSAEASMAPRRRPATLRGVRTLGSWSTPIPAASPRGVALAVAGLAWTDPSLVAPLHGLPSPEPRRRRQPPPRGPPAGRSRRSVRLGPDRLSPPSCRRRRDAGRSLPRSTYRGSRAGQQIFPYCDARVPACLRPARQAVCVHLRPCPRRDVPAASSRSRAGRGRDEWMLVQVYTSD